jgi:hypothetical protein
MNLGAIRMVLLRRRPRDNMRGALLVDDDASEQSKCFVSLTPVFVLARRGAGENGRARKHYLLPIQINKQLLITASTDALCGI